MRDKRHSHRRGRNTGGFVAHQGKQAARPGSDRGHKGRAWRFFDARSFCCLPFEQHFRRISRTLALPGKHVRTVMEPDRAAHGKGQ